jgi:hypothetical protein
MQKLELAHVVSARRLQEAGALGDPEEQYVSVQDRLEMMLSEAMRHISAAGGDAETAAVDTPSSLGKYLDVLPTAEDAIDYFMSKSTPKRPNHVPKLTLHAEACRRCFAFLPRPHKVWRCPSLFVLFLPRIWVLLGSPVPTFPLKGSEKFTERLQCSCRNRPFR